MDWARYWRAADAPLEAMRAHFERHAYHRHSHETYSFGFTETGAQAFTCRGGRHRSADGTVMAFNPDDPHDGGPVDPAGFTYRMVHIGPDLLSGVLADLAGRPVGLPLFAQPVFAAPELSRRLAALTDAMLVGAVSGDRSTDALRSSADELRRDELLAGTVREVVRLGGGDRVAPLARVTRPDAARIAVRARAALEAAVAGDGPPAETAVAALAGSSGHSHFTVYRSFRAAYGLSPSDYLRQCRLRSARAMLAAGCPAAEVAAATGFADQSHLTRWFGRYFGVTPAAYQRATTIRRETR